MAVLISIFTGNSAYTPMIAIPTIGFVYVAYLSIVHSSSFNKKKQNGGRPYAPAIAAGRHTASGGSATMTAATRSVDRNAGRRATRTVSQKKVQAWCIMGTRTRCTCLTKPSGMLHVQRLPRHQSTLQNM